jgi:hypothetical protein
MCRREMASKPPKRAKLPKLSDRVRVGPLEVSPVCLGVAFDEAVVSAAYEAGINFFFLTADLHWPLYEPTRRGLEKLLKKRGVRDRIVVAAAAYVTQPDFCVGPFEEVVESVPGLGHLDVAVAGGSYWNDFWPRLPIYLRHRETAFQGVRAVGASFHDRSLAREAVTRGMVDVAFARYNAGHPGAARDLFPHLPAKRAPVFTFKSADGWVTPERIDQLGIAPHFWRPAISDHYRFALSCPGVDGVLCALGKPAHVRELEDALAAGALSAEEQKYLLDLAQMK